MGRPLTPKEMRDTTLEFYSQFCRADLSKIEPGVHILCDPERDAVLKGLGRAYTIYLLAREGVCVLCASPRYWEAAARWRGLDRRASVL